MGRSLHSHLHPDAYQPGFQAIETWVRLRPGFTTGNLDWTAGREWHEFRHYLPGEPGTMIRHPENAGIEAGKQVAWSPSPPVPPVPLSYPRREASVVKTATSLDKAAERGHPSYIWRAGQERRFHMVRRWTTLRHRRVLDVGCGMGLYTNAFRRETPHVFGVEIELQRALEARDRAAGVAQANGDRLPFSDAIFDVVFSHEVLEHVADDRICAQEMVRVARPGGRIVVFVPNRLYAFETHGVFWRGRYHFGNVPLVNWLPTPLRDRLAPHVRAYTSRELLHLFEGLSVRIVHHSQVYPGYDNIVARAPALGRLIRRITHALERTPLRVFGLSHLLVLEKDPSRKR